MQCFPNLDRSSFYLLFTSQHLLQDLERIKKQTSETQNVSKNGGGAPRVLKGRPDAALVQRKKRLVKTEVVTNIYSLPKNSLFQFCWFFYLHINGFKLEFPEQRFFFTVTRFVFCSTFHPFSISAPFHLHILSVPSGKNVCRTKGETKSC